MTWRLLIQFFGCIASLFCLLVTADAIAEVSAETKITPAYFSHLATMRVTESHAVVVTATLPQWVYLASKQSLADLRVFNAAGIAVAHQLTPLVSSIPSRDVEVGLIAMPEDVTKALGEKSGTDLQIDAGGEVHIQLGQPLAAQSAPNSKVTDWVFKDSPVFQGVVTAFKFEVQAQDKEPFEATVAIETSTDLRSWQAVVSHQKLLQFGDIRQRLQQLSVVIPPTHATYWRIHIEQGDLQKLSKIWVSVSSDTKPIMERMHISCELSTDNLRVNCPLPATLPIESAKFDFGNGPIAFKVRVNSYRQSVRGLNPPVKTEPVQSVLLTLTQQSLDAFNLRGEAIGGIELEMQNGGPLGLSRPPMLMVEWVGQQLSFLAHGESPFVLAVGAEQLSQNVAQGIATNLAKTPAEIGMAKMQAPQMLKSVSTQKPWLLWTLLVSAVVILGLMAYQLLNEKAK